MTLTMELIGNIQNPDTTVCLNAVRVVDMVQETRALNLLAQRYQTEANPALKEYIFEVGQRLKAAQAQGYSTIRELFEVFQLNKRVQQMMSAAQDKAIERLNNQFEMEMLKEKQRTQNKNLATGAAMAGLGALAGGATMMTAGLGSMMSAGAGTASSNLGEAKTQISTQALPAPVPTDMPITIWVKRLLEGGTAEIRIKATNQLIEFNNPAAIQPLAQAYCNDPDATVKEAAQKAGKQIYLGVVYWEMEQDGSLAAELKRRTGMDG